MTVLAYRDGIFASDSQIGVDDTIHSTNWKKIFRGGDFFAGFCGEVPESSKLISWIKSKNLSLDDFPELSRNIDVLIIQKGKNNQKPRVFPVYNGCLYEDRSPYISIGAGSTVALGAFFVGATAIEAVKAAIQHNKSCGGRVQHLKF